MRTKPKAGNWVLPIYLIDFLKGNFILHDTLFNRAAGIQIKFHQDTMTHILKKILNVILKRSVVFPCLKPDKKRQTVYNNMTMIWNNLWRRIARGFSYFIWIPVKLYLCFLSVMHSCSFSLFHRDKNVNPINARLYFVPFNPIQAGVFCYYINWGCPPSFIKVTSIMTSLSRPWRHLCSVEYEKLIAENSLY